MVKGAPEYFLWQKNCTPSETIHNKIQYSVYFGYPPWHMGPRALRCAGVLCFIFKCSALPPLHHKVVNTIDEFPSEVMTVRWRIPVIRNWKLGYVIKLRNYTLHHVPLFSEWLSWNPTKTNPEPDLLYIFFKPQFINTLNAELNPICQLLALLWAHPILHVSRIRVKTSPLYALM
jgi:hypothetical protein